MMSARGFCTVQASLKSGWTIDLRHPALSGTQRATRRSGLLGALVAASIECRVVADSASSICFPARALRSQRSARSCFGADDRCLNTVRLSNSILCACVLHNVYHHSCLARLARPPPIHVQSIRLASASRIRFRMLMCPELIWFAIDLGPCVGLRGVGGYCVEGGGSA